MSEYPKHIRYYNSEMGRRLHAVARTPPEEDRIETVIETRGHSNVRKQPISEMDEAERAYKIDLNGNDPKLPF